MICDVKLGLLLSFDHFKLCIKYLFIWIILILLHHFHIILEHADGLDETGVGDGDFVL